MEQLSRKERRKTERQSRKGQTQKERGKHKRASRLQKLLSYLVGLSLLGGVGYWGYVHWMNRPQVEFVPSMGNRHIISSSEVGLTIYNSDPPTSGPHLPRLANWGIHGDPISKELQVHNLEDGGVMVQYSCSPASQECKVLIEKLAQIVRPYDEYVILAPYPKMSHKIALTAWSRIAKFNDFNEKRIVRFIDAYRHIDHHARR